jgi:hypothetical protein
MTNDMMVILHDRLFLHFGQKKVETIFEFEVLRNRN